MFKFSTVHCISRVMSSIEIDILQNAIEFPSPVVFLYRSVLNRWRFDESFAHA